MLTVGTTSLTIVGVIAAIAVASLVVALVLRRQVLAAGEGTPAMQDIAAAVQEGASAYLSRQFRTLAVFAAGLKDTIDGGIEQRLKGELIVTNDNASPLPAGAAGRIQAVAQVAESSPQYIDAIQVNGRDAKATTDNRASGFSSESRTLAAPTR